jgi:RNA polymerase sigma-70 factor (ECF subfamily)
MSEAKLSDAKDEAIVAHVRAKDQELYEVLVERYQAPLLRYVTSIIGDETLAADVVQEAFIKAFLNLNSFNTKLKFSSWLYRIAHNETVNYIKKHHREFMIDEVWWEAQPAPNLGLGKQLDQKLLRAKMAQLLGELPLKYREPLILYYFEDKSYAEISDVLRIPVPTVGTRINRAKASLKGILDREGINNEW